VSCWAAWNSQCNLIWALLFGTKNNICFSCLHNCACHCA
jgi:hypothetical protein